MPRLARLVDLGVEDKELLGVQHFELALAEQVGAPLGRLLRDHLTLGRGPRAVEDRGVGHRVERELVGQQVRDPALLLEDIPALQLVRLDLNGRDEGALVVGVGLDNLQAARADLLDPLAVDRGLDIISVVADRVGEGLLQVLAPAVVERLEVVPPVARQVVDAALHFEAVLVRPEDRHLGLAAGQQGRDLAVRADAIPVLQHLVVVLRRQGGAAPPAGVPLGLDQGPQLARREPGVSEALGLLKHRARLLQVELLQLLAHVGRGEEGALGGVGLVQFAHVGRLEQVRLEPGGVVGAAEQLPDGLLVVEVGPVRVQPRPAPEGRRADAHLLQAGGREPGHGVVDVRRQAEVDAVHDALDPRHESRAQLRRRVLRVSRRLVRIVSGRLARHGQRPGQDLPVSHRGRHDPDRDPLVPRVQRGLQLGQALPDFLLQLLGHARLHLGRLALDRAGALGRPVVRLAIGGLVLLLRRLRLRPGRPQLLQRAADIAERVVQAAPGVAGGRREGDGQQLAPVGQLGLGVLAPVREGDGGPWPLADLLLDCLLKFALIHRRSNLA